MSLMFHSNFEQSFGNIRWQLRIHANTGGIKEVNFSLFFVISLFLWLCFFVGLMKEISNHFFIFALSMSAGKLLGRFEALALFTYNSK